MRRTVQSPACQDEESAAPTHVVVIGASWGGLHALTTIVSALPPDFAAPVLVVQHRGKDAAGLLRDLLQDVTPLCVVDAEDKEPLHNGHVFIAPPDYHVLVDEGYLSLSTDAAVRYSRPSIDVALASVADSYGARAIGVVLTGANEDGAAGLRRIVERGGWGVVQNPDTAEVRTMPEAALRAVQATGAPRLVVAPLDRIGAELVALIATGASTRGDAPGGHAPGGHAP